ncbi:DUF6193 family natural product biosynthesis protein [Streptomyces baarnensis]|nr:DUF6193 family natural product biosynthesis protein [Streptomyces sp. ME02-6979.5a]MDX3342695.1 DUF6193 family natural product biosynthesis protein [Streptomyces sp. ME02-6979.5a]
MPDGRHRCLTDITVSCGRGEDRRRALFPFSSHGALAFHRNTEFPWSNDLPFIVGDVQACTVYAPLHASKRVLGSRSPRKMRLRWWWPTCLTTAGQFEGP